MRSGWGAIVYIVNKDGISTHFYRTKQSWFNSLIAYLSILSIHYRCRTLQIITIKISGMDSYSGSKGYSPGTRYHTYFGSRKDSGSGYIRTRGHSRTLGLDCRTFQVGCRTLGEGVDSDRTGIEGTRCILRTLRNSEEVEEGGNILAGDSYSHLGHNWASPYYYFAAFAAAFSVALPWKLETVMTYRRSHHNFDQ